MKYIIIVLALCSCTKNWECCTSSTTSDAQAPYEYVNGTLVLCSKFSGTTKEKNNIEDSGTTSYEFTYPIDYSVDQVTTCVHD